MMRNSVFWSWALTLAACSAPVQPSSWSALSVGQGDAGATGAAPRAVVWDIAGQSNATGHGVYTGNVAPVPLVSYFVDGIAQPLIPAIGAFHGIELGLAPVVTADGSSLVINKSAVDGMPCSLLTTTYWPQHAAGIAAVKGLGGDYQLAWIQGEADSGGLISATEYETCVRSMLAMVRAAFGAPVRAHIFLLNNGLDRKTYVALDTMRAVQRDIAATDGDADLVDMDDDPPHIDGVHYDSAQLIEMGRRFAAAAATD